MHVQPSKTFKRNFFKEYEKLRTIDESMGHDEPMAGTTNGPTPEQPASRKSEKPPTLPITVKRKIRRGTKKKKSFKSAPPKTLSILGVNADGLKGKFESLINSVDTLLPSVITIQETTANKKGNFRIDNFQQFERIREDRNGGGLITFVNTSLKPVLTHVGTDDNEIITVEINVDNSKVRIINAYGPQEDEPRSKVLSFWQEIDQEIVRSKEAGCYVLIQLDANAKIGNDRIKDDPNSTSKCKNDGGCY